MQARVSPKAAHIGFEAVPQEIVRDIAWKAQVRLCSRYRRLAAAGKPKVVVTTAIAREMVGFIWAIARQVQPRTSSRRRDCETRNHDIEVPTAGGGATVGEPSRPVMSRH